MAKFPALPLWTDSYLADTTHLSDAEHGRYLLLLIHLWRAPRQRFPNDDTWLARKFGHDENWVRENLRPLISEFCSNDGNWICQGRLSREFSFVAAQSQTQSDRAKARWKKEKSASRGNATPGNAPTPTPTPVEKDTDRTGTSTENLSERILLTPSCADAQKIGEGTFVKINPEEQKVFFPTWWPHEAWHAFVEMRAETKQPLNTAATIRAISTVTKLRDGGQDPAAVLDQSTLGRYRAIFPVKSAASVNGNGHGVDPRTGTLVSWEDTVAMVKELGAKKD